METFQIIGHPITDASVRPSEVSEGHESLSTVTDASVRPSAVADGIVSRMR